MDRYEKSTCSDCYNCGHGHLDVDLDDETGRSDELFCDLAHIDVPRHTCPDFEQVFFD